MNALQEVSPYLSVSECDDICPALRDTVDLFISGSHDEYIEQVEKYNQNSDVLETADTLKSCVDERLTAEDKQDALSALVGQAMYECACGARVRGRQGCQGPIQGTGRWGDHTFSTLTLPREPGRIKILMRDEVERMWPTPTGWGKIMEGDSVQPWSS